MSLLFSILKAIAAAAGVLDSLVAFLRERREIQAGEDRAAVRSMTELDTRVQKARAARHAVDTRSLPDDDPNLRD
jgi:hypothetical protein